MGHRFGRGREIGGEPILQKPNAAGHGESHTHLRLGWVTRRRLQLFAYAALAVNQSQQLLLEAVRIDGVTIPRYTPLYGLATISGMRLQVVVSSVEYGGQIFSVEASAYDLDGQPGLNVPNSRERTALKEALASVGQTAGTSVNVTRSAGQQVLSELARGGLQASSQYVAEKLREVKITLKANHQLLLISKQQ